MVKPSSKGLFGEDASVTSWRLPDVGTPKHPPQDVAPAAIQMPTAQEIEAIRQTAREEGHEEGHREGHEEGYALGRREGLSAAKTVTDDRLRRLDQILSALQAPLREMDEEVEESLVQLAIAISRQLLRREVRTDPALVLGVVREALAALPANSRNVRLHLHPEDAQLVEEAYGQGREVDWRIEKDPSLSRGGCRVFTDTSRIDATIETRLTSLIAPLLNRERRHDSVDEDVGDDHG